MEAAGLKGQCVRFSGIQWEENTLQTRPFLIMHMMMSAVQKKINKCIYKKLQSEWLSELPWKNHVTSAGLSVLLPVLLAHWI